MSKKNNACDKVGEIILDRDAFGEGFAFTLPNGKEKYTTWCGVLFTAIIYALIVLYGVMKLGKVTGYADTQIIESKEDSFFDSDYIWSSQDGMQFAFGITAYDDNEEAIEDLDYGQVVARY